MNVIKVNALYTYPLKSAQGMQLDIADVVSTGFEFDRSFGIINADNVLLTAREAPRLLQLNVSYIDSVLKIRVSNKETYNVDLNGIIKEPIQVAYLKIMYKPK